MDTMYGKSKYSRGFNDDSDCYRSTYKRPMSNFPSYPNTIARRASTASVAGYSHMNKYFYNADYNINGQNVYNSSWGVWKDSVNLAPSSVYSSKSRKSVRSFSILLLTAAFIVVLAVLSIAGLAFYFSTIKPDKTIMIFDGRLLVVKGDVFTTGLKYNHTSLYQQKSEFYTQYLIQCLEHSGIPVHKCEINGFGDGPNINLAFRIHLFMKNVPISIENIEEYIRIAILKEPNRSNNKTLHIDPESVNIKRSLEDEIRSASFLRNSASTPPSTTHYVDKVNKKIGTIEKSVSKFTSSTIKTKSSSTGEKRILQGSFEVTKTDADITHKKSSSHSSVTSTLRPFTISNGIQVKMKKTTIPEKLKFSSKIKFTTNRPSTTTPIDMDFNTTESTHITDSIELEETLTSQSQNIEYRNANSDLSKRIYSEDTNQIETTTMIEKSEMNLFPNLELDSAPWKPIDVKLPDSLTENNLNVTTRQKNKPTDAPNQFETLTGMPTHSNGLTNEFKAIPTVYHSYSYQLFHRPSQEIETLGSDYVKPYPLPVNKIQDAALVITNKKPIGPITLNQGEIFIEPKIPDRKISTNTPYEFEEVNKNDILTTTFSVDEITVLNDNTQYSKNSSILSENSREDSPETTTQFETTYSITEKLNFKNIKDVVLAQSSKKNNNSLTATTARTTNSKPNEMVEISDSLNPMIKETVDKSTLWNQPNLYPVISKWQLINGTTRKPEKMHKKFNETLKAWIVENESDIERAKITNTIAKNSSQNIQNISSIFDRLASKLGILPIFSTKLPPFAGISKNKQTIRTTVIPNLINHTVNKLELLPSSSTRTTVKMAVNKFSTPMVTNVEAVPIVNRDDGAGKAEVEVVDPNSYEEMLMMETRNSLYATSEHPVTLITLMPVKSNSGIRFAKPNIEKIPDKSRIH